MSGNTSASGGYLTPTTNPDADDALDDIIQAAVVGITGLPGNMVRPRFQQTPPRQPTIGTDWCAVGVMDTEPDAGPVLEHDPDGSGSDQYARHETLNVLASFYGPNAQRNARLLQDGLAIPQNNEQLLVNLLQFVNSGTIRRVAALVNEQWVSGFDLPFTFHRKTERTYQVLNVLEADVTFFDTADFPP